MATYSIVQRKRKQFIDELVQFSNGLDRDFVEKILVYSECLLSRETEDISEPEFILEMAHQFNMTNQYMISLIFEDMKISYVFRVYDIDHDKRLSKVEVYALLKPSLPQNDEEHDDMLRELIELVMKVVDFDANGSIDLDEFRNLVKKKNILYMDLLGGCLPDEKSLHTFKNKLLEKSVNEVKEFFLAENATGFFGDVQYQNLSSEYYPVTLQF